MLLWCLAAIVALGLVWLFAVFIPQYNALLQKLQAKLKTNKMNEELQSRLKSDGRYVVEVVTDPSHFALVGDVLVC